MNGKDLLLLAAKPAAAKTRTLLAVIGVVVGTCAIIVMLSIGFGMSANLRNRSCYGDLHLVNVYGGMYGPIRYGRRPAGPAGR